MHKKWPLATIVLGLLILNGCASNETKQLREAASALKSHDNSEYKSYWNESHADYQDWIQRVQQCTGASPKEVGEVTLKYHSVAGISCRHFMSAYWAHVTITRVSPFYGFDGTYEEGARAFAYYLAAP